ncbi:MAG: hypothetical protein QME12_07380 [Nanoarchaeota archaeon]|nr:hypothetical protein [Nanoarchaeota archaeon]
MDKFWNDVAKACKKRGGMLGMASNELMTCVIKTDKGELKKIDIASKPITQIVEEAFGK